MHSTRCSTSPQTLEISLAFQTDKQHKSKTINNIGEEKSARSERYPYQRQDLHED